MKKLLGISLVAALAVAPSLANAAITANSVTLINNGNTPTANTNVATTSYVQGAYNALGKEVNAIITDTTVTGESHNYIANDKNVAENLVALDTQVKTIADQSGDYVTHTEGTVTVGENQSLTYLTGSTAGTNVGSNLGKLDIAIKANADNIATNTTNIATNASDINTLEGRMDTAEANINELQTNMSTAQNDIDALEGRMDTAEGDIDALEGKVGTLSDGTYTDGQTVGADISALDTGLNNLATTVSTLSGNVNGAYAKKVGVTKTIDDSTATLTVYTTWNTDTRDTTAAAIDLTGATYAEPVAPQVGG